jgi:hypothetical protein
MPVELRAVSECRRSPYFMSTVAKRVGQRRKILALVKTRLKLYRLSVTCSNTPQDKTPHYPQAWGTGVDYPTGRYGRRQCQFDRCESLSFVCHPLAYDDRQTL